MKRLAKSMIWPLTIVFCLGIVVWLSRSGEASAVPEKSQIEENGFRIEIQSLEANSSSMDERHFLVKVTDTSGAPVETSSIQMKSWMPKMFCGIFTASFSEPSSEGGYEATLFPVMSGRWVAEAQIRIGDKDFTLRHEYDVG